MSDVFELSAQVRDDVRRGASRRLRHAGFVPAIVYGAGLKPECIKLSHDHVMHALGSASVYSHILTLDVAGEKEQVVLKAIQRHPYKRQIMHLDFLRIKANEKLFMTVPLHFVHEEKAPGVLDKGTAIYHLKDVDVQCFPVDLPEFIEVDLAALQLNQVFHLSDLILPKGVELDANLEVEEQDLPVISIQMVREVSEEEAPAPVKTEILTAKVEEGEETSTES
jgi:large subunit ribosomal protein L25